MYSKEKVFKTQRLLKTLIAYDFMSFDTGYNTFDPITFFSTLNSGYFFNLKKKKKLNLTHQGLNGMLQESENF